MKTPLTSLAILIFISLGCQSCLKEPSPAFSYEPATNPESGEDIEFINESLDAKDFYWDFGNGLTSEEEMPSTIYYLPGTYTVTLVAENLFHSDSISENILIYPPTILEFSYYDYDGNPLKLARVELYHSSNDASSAGNIIQAGTTNTNGMVVFNNLEPIQYYIWMEKPEYGGAYLSGGYVGPLEQNVINGYWSWAEYFTMDEKKSAELKEIHFIEPR
jgi:hypothetical protein